MYTSFSSSGGSCSTRSSLFRLCLWLSWYRKKSAVLFFSRSRTNPRLGTRAEGTDTSVQEKHLVYRSQPVFSQHRQTLNNHKDQPAGSLADGLNRQRVNWASAELCSSSVWQYSIILAQIWEITQYTSEWKRLNFCIDFCPCLQSREWH